MNIETEVVRMGDVGTMIDMVDACIAEGNADQTERAAFILKEIFANRYRRLRETLYEGGAADGR